MNLISWIWHTVRRYEYIQAEVVNAEAGTMDDYCTCWLCKRRNRL